MHVPGHMLDAQPDKVPEFYRQLLAALEALGAKTEVLRRIPDDLACPRHRVISISFIWAGWRGPWR